MLDKKYITNGFNNFKGHIFHSALPLPQISKPYILVTRYDIVFCFDDHHKLKGDFEDIKECFKKDLSYSLEVYTDL